MMTEFFDLRINPFEKGSIGAMDAFMSEDHQQILNLGAYLVEHGGIALVTARPGLGKTYALAGFLKSLNPSRFTPVYLSNTTLGVTDFYRDLCSALGLDSDGYRSRLIERLRRQIRTLSVDAQQPLVLVIDEAQELSRSLLDELRLLTNFRCDSVNYFSLILSGEKRLRDTLKKAVYESFRQRIVAHYDCKGLSPDETYRYVIHKLQFADAQPGIVTPALCTKLCEIAHGIPRKVDQLMTNALQLAAQQEIHSLNEDLLLAAASAMAF